MTANDRKQIGMTKNFTIEVQYVQDKNQNNKPIFLITTPECQYLSKSIVVEGIEYIAKYDPGKWAYEHGYDSSNEESIIELPNGEKIAQQEYLERFMWGEENLN